MDEFINLIRKADGFCSLSGVSSSQVEQAEKELGLEFADDYKSYVLTFGAASFDGRELTGICSSDRLCVIPVTKRARDFYSEFPKNMYVVEELQFDYMLTLQDHTGAIFSYGLGNEVKQIAASLQEYLFCGS